MQRYNKNVTFTYGVAQTKTAKLNTYNLTVSYNGTSYNTNTTINNIVNGTTAYL